MRLRYDKTADALDIVLAEDVAVSRTEQLDPGTLVDLDMHGRVLAIEIISPGRAWPLEEIIGRFDIADADAGVLRGLWRQPMPYPFAADAQVGTSELKLEFA
jgi:uncharacterized protein YuzE